MKTIFSNREFKVNDEVVSIFGNGIVKDVNEMAVKVLLENNELVFFNHDGKMDKEHQYPSFFHTDNNPFELAGKYLEMQKSGGVPLMRNPPPPPAPTETPIEELGKNDSVFCIANGDCVTEGKTYFVTRNYGDGIAIIDDERDEHDYDWSEAKQLFRTSPPQTETPIPKITNYEKPTSYSGSASGINRAELLEVVKSVAVYYSDAAKCVNYAKALINEVDKEVENGK